MANYSCPRCKHAACFVLKVHVAQREELVSGRARHWVHEEREVARLGPRSLAAVTHAHCQETADAVVVRCLKERAPHVGLALQLLVRGGFFAGGRLRRENQEHNDSTSSIATSKWRCRQKRSWANWERNGPWCDMDGTRHAQLPQELSTEPSSRICCAAPRALAPAAPGDLPRVDGSGC